MSDDRYTRTREEIFADTQARVAEYARELIERRPDDPGLHVVAQAAIEGHPVAMRAIGRYVRDGAYPTAAR